MRLWAGLCVLMWELAAWLPSWENNAGTKCDGVISNLGQGTQGAPRRHTSVASLAVSQSFQRLQGINKVSDYASDRSRRRVGLSEKCARVIHSRTAQNCQQGPHVTHLKIYSYGRFCEESHSLRSQSQREILHICEEPPLVCECDGDKDPFISNTELSCTKNKDSWFWQGSSIAGFF